MALIRAIALRDAEKALRLLEASPALARQAVERGATRQISTSYYFTGIEHYVYAGDTALHIAAAAYARDIATMLLARGASARSRNRRAPSRFTTPSTAVPARLRGIPHPRKPLSSA